MAPQDRISRLAQQIGDRLQNASQAPEEIQKGVQQVVRGAFDRLELVSREDFDILMDVLQRTRARVEALEAQVAKLEAAIDTPQSEVRPPVAAPAPKKTAAATSASTKAKAPDADATDDGATPNG
ncbi:accessory factor UbiK family protein [Halomonas dongshanensis]|uniref:Ubiquinone biosynthesis accessory factor UbiK n=1 Tax=Halomonas dongshanensis TaxID=2890835 RepID=A0ABT2E8S8_9GAMM|nr:accessory factor UbiK family protein [Halomonas dongshanensis]MCS2607961.1 accessory factor UbiK family protein [Halomonas dongshanensis]